MAFMRISNLCGTDEGSKNNLKVIKKFDLVHF